MGIPQGEFLFPHPLQSLLAETTQDLIAQAVVFSSGQLLIMDTMQKPAHLLIPHMIVRFAPFVLVIRKTWPSVVDIRLVATVEKTSKYAQFAGAQSKLELDSSSSSLLYIS